MSTSDGQPSRGLSDALDEIFSRGSAEPAEGELGDVPDATPQPYELPEIVPATVDATEDEPASEPPAETIAPTLPGQRTARPATAIRPEPRSAPIPSAAGSAPHAATGSAPAAAAAPAARATGWSDHMTSIPTGGGGGAGLRTPGRRPRVRRVTRVLRHIDPWSTFKVGLLFSLVTYLVLLTSGVLLWRVADSTGTLANVERWFTQFGWETFELKGGEIFHNAWIIGLFGAVGMTGGLVLLATLFNLVSDIIGGIRLTVLEEEVVERTVTSTRRYVVRQGPAPAGGAATAAQDWDVDDDTAPPNRSVPDAEATQPIPTADWSVDDD